MSWLSFVPFLFGAAAVLQPSLNQQLTRGRGLATVVCVNAGVLLVFTTCFFLLTRFMPERFPPNFTGEPAEMSAGSASSPAWPMWFFMPGFLGFCLVVGLPLCIEKFGAFATFTGVLSGQLILSLILDAMLYGRNVTLVRIIGVALSFVGALLASKK